MKKKKTKLKVLKGVKIEVHTAPSDPPPYWPKPGETVRILKSPHVMGSDKVGVVQYPSEGGFVIIASYKDPWEKGPAKDHIIWAETVEPYTEIKENEQKR